MKKRILFLQRQHPGLKAKESLDAALVASVFDEQVSLLFRNEGVLQLAGDDGDEQERTLSSLIRSLPEYGIDNIFACEKSLVRAGLTPDVLIVPVQSLNSEAQGLLLAQQDMVLND